MTETPVITEMMAATPATIPTKVRIDRSLWAPIAATAILKDSIQVTPHSYRKASIGASFEARIAGHMPKTKPTTEQKITPRTAQSAGT